MPRNLFAGQQWGDGHGERGGEGGMYGGSDMETCITMCRVDSQWEFAVWLRKLKQGLCVGLERWDGEGGVGEVSEGRGYYGYPWLIHVEV